MLVIAHSNPEYVLLPHVGVFALDNVGCDAAHLSGSPMPITVPEHMCQIGMEFALHAIARLGANHCPSHWREHDRSLYL